MKFQIESDNFASGGQSSLRLVRVRESGLLVVEKRFKKLKDLKNEAQIIDALLPHPNIIHPICWQSDKRGHVLYLPYHPGGSLSKIPFGLGSEQCASIVLQLVSVVKYVHSMGFLHHDIKPANILFSLDPPNITLIDFGLACMVGKQRPHTGTRFAMAPEVHQAKGFQNFVLDQALDWWGVGVTTWMLFQMVRIESAKAEDRGHRVTAPFQVIQRRHRPKRRRVRYVMRPFPDHFGEHLRNFLTLLLEPNPLKRRFDKIGIEEHQLFSLE